MYGIFLTFPNINFPVRPIGKQNITALTSEHLSTIYFNHSQTSYKSKEREADASLSFYYGSRNLNKLFAFQTGLANTWHVNNCVHSFTIVIVA